MVKTLHEVIYSDMKIDVCMVNLKVYSNICFGIHF